MENILERVGCPSTSLIKCPRSPIGEGEITALIHNLKMNLLSEEFGLSQKMVVR